MNELSFWNPHEGLSYEGSVKFFNIMFIKRLDTLLLGPKDIPRYKPRTLDPIFTNRLILSKIITSIQLNHQILKIPWPWVLVLLWRHGLVVITTEQLHSTKPKLRFWACSNPACGVSKIHACEDLWQWLSLEIRLNVLSSVNHTTKTDHHLGLEN